MEAFGRAKKICENQNDELGIAHFNEKIALVCRSHGQFETAILSFEEALRYYEQNRIADRIAFVLSGLGELKHKMGQSREALDYLRRALQIYERLGAGKPAALVAAEINVIQATLEYDEKGGE